jgi:hypothetical protein
MAAVPEYWFRPKLDGYGAVPSHWKGWALVGAYVAAVLALTSQLLGLPAQGAAEPMSGKIVIWGTLLAFLTLGFLLLCRIKTDGGWRWRKGGKG